MSPWSQHLSPPKLQVNPNTVKEAKHESKSRFHSSRFESVVTGSFSVSGAICTGLKTFLSLTQEQDGLKHKERLSQGRGQLTSSCFIYILVIFAFYEQVYSCCNRWFTVGDPLSWYLVLVGFLLVCFHLFGLGSPVLVVFCVFLGSAGLYFLLCLLCVFWVSLCSVLCLVSLPFAASNGVLERRHRVMFMLRQHVEVSPDFLQTRSSGRCREGGCSAAWQSFTQRFMLVVGVARHDGKLGKDAGISLPN